MGPEYFTVAAYFDGECTIICRACGEKKRLPASAQITEANLGEWEDGLYCDSCSEEIVEPTLRCQVCDDTITPFDDDELCPSCYRDREDEEAEAQEEGDDNTD